MTDDFHFDGTGLDFERAVFGFYSGPQRKMRFSRFPAARDQAISKMKKTGWNPNQIDSSLLINNLVCEVYKKILEDYCKEGTFELEVWPTLGTPLDSFHGVDGLFRFYNKKTKKRKEKGKQRQKVWTYVYFDISLSEEKKQGERILILRYKDFVDEDAMEVVVNNIASRLAVSVFH